MKNTNPHKNKVWYWHQKELFGVDPITLRRESRKRFILSLVGMKCQFCGYDRCTRNLSFHHTRDKVFKLTQTEFQYSFETTYEELQKCVVTCHNCHGEIHDNLIDEDLVISKNEEFSAKVRELNGKKWSEMFNHYDSVKSRYDAEYERILNGGENPAGGIRVKKTTKLIKCVKCEAIVRRTKRQLEKNPEPQCHKCIQPAVWPSDDKLRELVQLYPLVKIAKIIGVSDVAVKRALQRRGISKLAPGAGVEPA